MSDRFRRMALVVLLGVATVPSVGRAHADEPATVGVPADLAAEARRQYNLGKSAYETGRFAEAALAWEAAAAIKPHAATLFSAALAWERASHPERAADDFTRATVLPGLTPEQVSTAVGRIAALEHVLGTLDVTGPEGWRVQIDALTEVGVPARLHAVPGAHALLVRAPGQTADHVDVALVAGQTALLVLNSAAPKPGDIVPEPPRPCAAPPRPPPAQAPAPRTSPGSLTRHSAGFGVLGMGIATLGAAAVLGAEALGARNAYDAGPTQAAYDHARAMQTWTDVAFIAGGVLAGGGLALALWPPPKSKMAASLRLMPSWNGAGLRGEF